MKLSVIIPAFNEAANLRKGCLDEVVNFLKKKDFSSEIIIVDDGSKDETIELVENYIKGKKNIRLIKNNHGGKAIAVMTGLLQSEGKIALFTDMDQATPISEIEKLLPKFKEGFDIAIGSRSGREGAPIVRKFMAWGFSVLRNIVLGLPFKDTQCGFKAFNRSSIQEIFPKLLSRWKNMSQKGAAVNAGFDVETLFLAKKKGFKIAEVSVSWHHVGTERVQIIKDSIDAVLDIFRIRLDDLQNKQ